MAIRMARYDVRNDGIGPYAVFYCDRCSREYRTQPDVKSTVTSEVSRGVLGGLLRNIPIFGGVVASSMDSQSARNQRSLTEQQLTAVWDQVKDVFHECPTCHQLVCNSDWDGQSGLCSADTPRKAEVAQAQGEQAAGMMKGIASAFGLDAAVKAASQGVKQAMAQSARCPNDGSLAKAGTKFCASCGAAMVQPQADNCPKCGAAAAGAKFCPECGTKMG